MSDKNEITKTKTKCKKNKNKKSTKPSPFAIIFFLFGIISLFGGLASLESPPKSAGPYGMNVAASAIGGMFLIVLGGILLLVAIISISKS